MDYYPPLYGNGCYHIFNRGNNSENIFRKHDNYFYFLQQYDYYLNDYIETYAYCLLPNHFHLLVRVKDFETQKPELKKGLKTLTEVDEIVSELFRRLFTSYAKAINKQENRTGSLFQKNFKRIPVNNQAYFNQLIYYIHANPKRHGIIDDFKQYPYSSYGSILSNKPTKLYREQAIDWFGSKQSFETFHRQKQNLRDISNWMIEDE